MTKKPKFPSVLVKLSGTDGNVFNLIGKVTSAMRHAGIDDDCISEFHEEVKMGDYDHAIKTIQKWVEVE
jgi:hypothetical protein